MIQAKITILILLLLNAGNLLADGVYRLVRNGSADTHINVRTINGHDYADFRNIGAAIIPGGSYHHSKREFSSEVSRLKCTPGSFFILFEDSREIHIAQMPLPVIELNQRIYIPVSGFFNTMAGLGVFEAQINGRNIFLKKYAAKTSKQREPSDDLASEYNDSDSETRALLKLKERIEAMVREENREVKTDKKKYIKAADKKAENKKQDNPFLQWHELEQKESLKQDREEGSVPDTEEQYRKPSETEVTNEEADSKPMPTKSEIDGLPNQYIIPRGLKRKEIRELRENSQPGGNFFEEEKTEPDQGRIEEGGWIYPGLIAAAGPFGPAAPCKIIKIYADARDNQTEIHLIADKIIEKYQKPEIKDGRLILRFPDVINGISDYGRLEGVYPLGRVELELIRNFILYKIEITGEVDGLSSRRNGPREIIYSIAHDGRKPVIAKDLPEELPEHIEPVAGKKKWDLDVIVIDPGHGGKDPGAISISKRQEKELALDIALKLRNLIISKMPDTKVVMTREDDTFIELYKRGHIANKAKGKLFISIHLNSMPKKPYPSNGFETYILRPGRNDDAVRVANKENSVIKFEKDVSRYKKLTEEELIIATMAQSAFVRLSELFARILQEEVGKTTPLADRGVNQAGFYVLVGASMPNVLFEAGFLSNKNDEIFLLSENGRKQIAEGMFNAVRRYAQEYKSLIGSND